jgi:putative ABC transport system permease protein
MKLHQLVGRNLRRRPLATVLTTLSVALGVALFSAIGSLRQASENAFQRSAGMSNLIIGAKGSPLELTLNSLYHMGVSGGNISYQAYREFRDAPGVQWSAPMVVGDAYRGFRVVGTTDEMFAVKVPELGTPSFSSGAAWKHSRADLDAFHAEVVAHAAIDEAAHTEGGQMEDAHDHDHDHDHAHDHTLEELADELGLFVAVIGATVAQETGLKVGSSFVPAHDVMTGGGAHEDAPTRVVGVLAPTGTPIDRAIYIPAGAFYAIAGHQAQQGSAFGGTRDPHGVSAVLAYVTPSGGYHLRTRYAWNDRLDVQAAWPVMEVRKLFGVVGNIDAALRIIAALVVVVALVGVLVALSNTMGARKREFAVLRALGARRRTILALVVGESAAISLFGGILGLGLAALGAWLAASRVRAETGVSISALPGLSDLWFLLAVTAVGALAGLVPAWRAYRTEAARALSSSL